MYHVSPRKSRSSALRKTINASRYIKITKDTLVPDRDISTTSHINAELSAKTIRIRDRNINSSMQKYPGKMHQNDVQRKVLHQFAEERDVSGDDGNVEVTETTDILDDLGKDPQKVYLTFDLLKSMTPKNTIRYLSAAPIFLRTMFIEGKLDPDIVTSVALSLTQSELQRFMLNMTQEMNFYTTIQDCSSLNEFELRIPKLIAMQRATIWLKVEHADYLASNTLKSVVPIDQSVVGYVYQKKGDYTCGDPGDFPNFSITYDLPILRGAKSMMLLPITTPSDEIVAVLQLVGIKDRVSERQTEFSPYYVEVFKVVRDLIQKKFFSVPIQRVLPSTVSTIFSNIEKASVKHTVNQISKFFTSTIPCEQCEIYEFDDRYQTLIRLSDDQRFGESDGGVSYAAGISTAAINIPHGHVHPALNSHIDGKFMNRSQISRSLQQGRNHYVLTLRAKPNAPAFSSDDIRLLSEITPILCDALRISSLLENQLKANDSLIREHDFLLNITDIIFNIASNGRDRFAAIVDMARKFFLIETMFICVFDGRYMVYYPTSIKCRFEDCAAGTAYNYRETVYMNPEETKSDFATSLYSQLKVSLKKSISFPYRANGKVTGAIELINPEKDDINDSEQQLFSNLVGTLMHDKIAATLFKSHSRLDDENIEKNVVTASLKND